MRAQEKVGGNEGGVDSSGGHSQLVWAFSGSGSDSGAGSIFPRAGILFFDTREMQIDWWKPIHPHGWPPR